MALSFADRLSIKGNGLKSRLTLVALLLVLFPLAVTVYLFYGEGVFHRMPPAHVFIASTTLAVVLSGLLMLRRVFDDFIGVAAALKRAEAGEAGLMSVEADTAELREISSSFNSLMGRFEATARRLEENTTELLLLGRAIRNIKMGVTITDINHRITYVNPTDAEMHGYSVEELHGKDARAFAFAGAGRDVSLEEMDGMGTWARESTNVRKDGASFPVYLVSDIVRNDGGEPIGVVTVCEDITERKLFEDGLVRAKEEWERTFDAVVDPVLILDDGFRITRANRAAAATLGARPEELVGRTCYEAVHRTGKPFPQCPYGKLLESGEAQSAEIFEEAFGGHCIVSVSPVFGPDGRLAGAVHISKDISERKKAEEARERYTDELEKYSAMLIDREDRLREYKEHLEDLVRERTAELERLNERLLDDIEERKRVEKELKESEERYRGVVEDQTELICRFRRDGTLTFVNDAYCRYFGKKREELLGTDRLSFLPDAEREGVREMSLALNHYNPVATYSYRLVLPGDVVVWQEWTDRVVFERQDKFLEYQAVGRDITGKKMAEDALMEKTLQLKDALRRAEAASRAKSEFLSNVSHELMTPLNAIVGFSEVMLKDMAGATTERQRGHLKDIWESGRRLTSIIETVIELSRTGPGKEEVEVSEFEVKALLEGCVGQLMPAASEKGMAVGVEVDAGVGAVVADRAKIGQVVENLLGNAVKFTPRGGRVRLFARPRPGCVEVGVEDTGPGISEEDQKRLFRPFEQLDATLTKRHQGVGLGLYLSKKIVEMHGGRIWVESRAGEGSRFVFTIPERHFKSQI